MPKKLKDITTQDELTFYEPVDTPKCKYCKKSIWYENCDIKIKESGELSYRGGTTYKTHKNIYGVDYNICVCQHCMEKYMPEFKSKNKSRIFNTFNEFVSFAFDIPEEIINKRNKDSAITLENFINTYGEIEGTKRFESYKEKQAYSNSFEYKHQKYGWTKEQYDEFNKSRAVTYENLIKKHGIEEGEKIWNNYCERQSYTASNEYYYTVFDKKKADAIVNLKSHKLEGFIGYYGYEEGTRLFNEYLNSINEKNSYAKIYSQSNRARQFFNKLKSKLVESGYDFCYYYGDTEFTKYSNKNKCLYSLDFYIKELQLDIEFNGDYWHANPKMYKSDWINTQVNMSALDIWKKDNERITSLYEEHNIETYVVWENDVYERNMCDEIIDEIINKVKDLCIKKLEK